MAVKTLDDFEKQIDDWHESEDEEQELHEYLKLSWEQYETLINKGKVDV